jgi:hypothetical protein
MKRHVAALLAGVALVVTSPVVMADSKPPIPQIVLITTSGYPETTSGMEDDEAVALIREVYNEYIRLVMQNMDAQFRQMGIDTRSYFHEDVTTSMRQSVFDMMIENRFDGIVQLAYEPVNTPDENSMYMNIDYLVVQYTPAEGGTSASFQMGCGERYRIWSEGLRGSASASDVANDFVEEIQASVFEAYR